MSKAVQALCDVADAAQLFGTTHEKILSRVKTGRFPLKPSATMGDVPMWSRTELEAAANSYWTGAPNMVWVHPAIWPTASEAAEEQIFYRQMGAVIFGGPGEYALHVPATLRPANALRRLKRYGANINWQLREFRPRSAN